MAKKGIKVKDLASRLGITTRQLIGRCRAEGLLVQNSITKVSSASEQLIRGWFATQSLQEPVFERVEPVPSLTAPSSGALGGHFTPLESNE